MKSSWWWAAVLALAVPVSAVAQDTGAPPPQQPSQQQPPVDTGPAPIDILAGQHNAPSQGESGEAPIDILSQKHQEQPKTAATGPGGFEIGLRLDAQVPLGDTFKGTPLKNMVSGQAALQLDLGWRIDPRWEVGAFFRYGLGFVNGCTENVSCSAHDVRLGLEGQLHLLPDTKVDPWVGLGAGYEFFTVDASTSAVDTSVTYKGATFGLVDAGADYALSPSFGLGPYVELAAGQFSSIQSGDLTNKALHFWLGLGVRGWFDIR